MKTITIPNIRFLILESEHLGGDWLFRAEEIDESLESFGFELSEESVFLFFHQSPESLLMGEGSCDVARPVVGPLKLLPLPFKIQDDKSRQYFCQTLKQTQWSHIFEECVAISQEYSFLNHKTVNRFILRINRKLNTQEEYELTMEILLYW